jgi:hypothetical protein
VRALEKKRLEYLLAHLADPTLVDARVAEYRQSVASPTDQARTFIAFDRLLTETNDHYLIDPQLLRELRILAREAEWQVNENQAIGTGKTIADHKVYMRLVGKRWFLENRQE